MLDREESRRDVLVGGMSLGVLAAMPASAASPRASTRPNVLFILADDLGYADLSCYGRTDYQTPVIDRLAAAGLLMTQGYANSPVCSATRVALATGRYQYRLPVGLPEPLGPATPLFVPPEHPTIASQFKQLGYSTALIGKWHLGVHPEHSPLKSGYDHYFGFDGGGSDYFEHTGPDRRGNLWENDRRIAVTGYLTDILAEKAAEHIRRRKGNQEPFFLSLHFSAPHWPWEGPDDAGLAKAIAGDLRHTDGGSIGKYGEMVRALDSSIGRVLTALKQTGDDRNTIVVFTSDNGGERFANTWPFNGRKGELLEGGLRVPVIIRWPARIRAGSRSDQVISSMDFMPTLLAAAGGASSETHPSDGEDLLDVITGVRPAHARRLFWRYKGSNQAAVRDGNWKYLLIGGKEFLFDVAEDPQERANLKYIRSDIFTNLKQLWSSWNQTMLPYPDDSYTQTPKSNGNYADRY